MHTLGSKKHGSVATYIILCLCITLAGSLLNPVLSLYLTTELNFTPLKTSFVFILLPIVTVVVVQTFAKLSDGVLQRPLIIFIACLFGIACPYFLSLRPSFILFCTVGIALFSVFPVAFPQIFASAREYALKYMETSVMYTTFLRCLASLSWVIGPPVAYTIATGYSFDHLFFACALAYAIAGTLTFFFLPHIEFDGKVLKELSTIKWYKNHQVLLLFFATAGLFTAFSSYIITMPLYVTQELGLNDKLPGLLLGLAAFIEIPLMLISARIVKRAGLKNLVCIGGFCLVGFLVMMCIVKAPWQFISIQLLSATFIALVSNLGMIFFQELLSKIPGQATSIYINACTTGQIIGGALIGLAATGSYRAVYLTGVVVALLSCIALCFVKKQVYVH